MRSYLFEEVHVQLCSFVINITESMNGNFHDTSFRRAFPLWSTCMFLDRRIWASKHLHAMMMQRRFLLTSFLSFVQLFKLGIMSGTEGHIEYIPFTSVQKKIINRSLYFYFSLILFLSNFKFSNVLATTNTKLRD